MNKITFIGAGNMASAIITGLINKGFDAKNIMVSDLDANKCQALQNELNINQTQDNIEAAKFGDIIVLCVKPQFISVVCEQVSPHAQDKSFMSIAAGIPISQIQKALGSNLAVVRVMPNTPAQLGLGMSGAFASAEVNKEIHKLADQILNAVGKTIWLESEEKINAVTAISGSGPAYFFLFMEELEKQALALGFAPEDARILVAQTALGASQMVLENDLSISTLRENVTSKGGTTAAALNQFMTNDLGAITAKAVNAAQNRAVEMAKEND